MDQVAKLNAAVQAALQLCAERDVKIVNMSVDLVTLQARIRELETPAPDAPLMASVPEA